MVVDINEVAVELDLWRAVKSGDTAARDKLKSYLDGVVLYMHALAIDPSTRYVYVSIHDLNEANVVDSVTLHTHDGFNPRKVA